MKIGIVSDTHGKMNGEVAALFKGVEVIIHAGDIGNEDVILTLASIAPVYAVYGNTDGFDIVGNYPEWRLERIGHLEVFVIHTLLALTPDVVNKIFHEAGLAAKPAVLVYGHTHRARIEYVDEVLTINPGSAGPRRFDTTPSVAFLEIAADGKMHAWYHEIT